MQNSITFKQGAFFVVFSAAAMYMVAHFTGLLANWPLLLAGYIVVVMTTYGLFTAAKQGFAKLADRFGLTSMQLFILGNVGVIVSILGVIYVGVVPALSYQGYLKLGGSENIMIYFALVGLGILAVIATYKEFVIKVQTGVTNKKLFAVIIAVSLINVYFIAAGLFGEDQRRSAQVQAWQNSTSAAVTVKLPEYDSFIADFNAAKAPFAQTVRNGGLGVNNTRGQVVQEAFAAANAYKAYPAALLSFKPALEKLLEAEASGDAILGSGQEDKGPKYKRLAKLFQPLTADIPAGVTSAIAYIEEASLPTTPTPATGQAYITFQRQAKIVEAELKNRITALENVIATPFGSAFTSFDEAERKAQQLRPLLASVKAVLLGVDVGFPNMSTLFIEVEDTPAVAAAKANLAILDDAISVIQERQTSFVAARQQLAIQQQNINWDVPIDALEAEVQTVTRAAQALANRFTTTDGLAFAGLATSFPTLQQKINSKLEAFVPQTIPAVEFITLFQTWTQNGVQGYWYMAEALIKAFAFETLPLLGAAVFMVILADLFSSAGNGSIAKRSIPMTAQMNLPFAAKTQKRSIPEPVKKAAKKSLNSLHKFGTKLKAKVAEVIKNRQNQQPAKIEPKPSAPQANMVKEPVVEKPKPQPVAKTTTPAPAKAEPVQPAPQAKVVSPTVAQPTPKTQPNSTVKAPVQTAPEVVLNDSVLAELDNLAQQDVESGAEKYASLLNMAGFTTTPAKGSAQEAVKKAYDAAWDIAESKKPQAATPNSVSGPTASLVELAKSAAKKAQGTEASQPKKPQAAPPNGDGGPTASLAELAAQLPVAAS